MPWKSDAQRRWGNSPAGHAALGDKGVAEWNSASKGMKLPKRVKKADGGSVNPWDFGGGAIDEALSSGPMEPFQQQSWMYRLPKTKDTGPTRSIPPGLLLQNRGIKPSRKHGDAIDYDSGQIIGSGDPRYYTRATKRMADGGSAEEPNPWEQLPKSLEGRPQLTITKPRPTFSDYASQFFAPSEPQIKPDRPPTQGLQTEPSQIIGQGIRGLGAHQLEEFKELANPFTKNEEGQYVADQPLPEDAFKGKVPQTQKDIISKGAPIVGEVISCLLYTSDAADE